MSTPVFKQTANQPINPKLEMLEEAQTKVAEIIKEKDTVISQIRQGFVECVVVFIDLVDSTKFKIDNVSEPEKWVLRIKQFGDVIKEYFDKASGKVVKYIGDEVMGIFDTDTKIDDALSLIQRINNIEANLTEITGAATKVKIAIDFGNVYLIEYKGHEELDPQGTPIDRCARIGKYCEAGTILSSYEFVCKTTFPRHWSRLGNVEMKGLGSQPIYQYGEQTIELRKKVEILEDEFNKLKHDVGSLTNKNQELILERKDLLSIIGALQEQLKKAGKKPVIETDFVEKEQKEQSQEDWEKIDDKFWDLRKIIEESGVPNSEYARFLFLHERGIPEEYNVYKNRAFDASIEKNLVKQDSNGRFRLNMSNKRNEKAVRLIDEIGRLLQPYANTHGVKDEDDLYEYSFSDSDFWVNRIGFNVS